jgi:hypothetical protein
MSTLRNVLTPQERSMGVKQHLSNGAVETGTRCSVCTRIMTAVALRNNDTGMHRGCAPSNQQQNGFKSRVLADDEIQEQRLHYFGPKEERGGKGINTIPATSILALIQPKQRISCKKCYRDQFHLTSPACWPVTVVAVTCSTCGCVVGYFDETVSKTLLDADPKHEMPARQSSIMHRTYRPNYSEDQQRALVVEGLKLEVPIDQIAEDLELTVEYVHSVAVNAGYRAAIFQYKIDSVGVGKGHGQPHQQAQIRAELVRNLVAVGKTDKEIALELHLNLGTAKNYRHKLRLKANSPWTKRAECRKRYLAGEHVSDIAAALEIDTCQVSVAIQGMEKHKTDKLGREKGQVAAKPARVVKPSRGKLRGFKAIEQSIKEMEGYKFNN